MLFSSSPARFRGYVAQDTFTVARSTFVTPADGVRVPPGFSIAGALPSRRQSADVILLHSTGSEYRSGHRSKITNAGLYLPGTLPTGRVAVRCQVTPTENTAGAGITLEPGGGMLLHTRTLRPPAKLNPADDPLLTSKCGVRACASWGNCTVTTRHEKSGHP